MHFMQVNFRSWNFGAVGRKIVFEEIIKTQNAFPMPWLTKSAHLERYPKGSGALQGSKRSLLLFSLRNQVITFWRMFFLENESPSELNKCLHSCPAIFPLFFVIAQILNVQVQILTVQVQMFGLDATRLSTVAPRIYRYLRGLIDIYLILPFRRVLS